MASRFSSRPPAWFKIAAIVLILWGLIGCASFYFMYLAYDPAFDPAATDWDRRYRGVAGMPLWLGVVYFAAVAGGTAAAIALLTRSKFAVTLAAISLIAVVVQFGWTFAATGIIAEKGVMTAVAFPAVIFLVALFQFWLANKSKRRGWLR